MSYALIESTIKDLMSMAFPPPYTVAQPAIMSIKRGRGCNWAFLISFVCGNEITCRVRPE